MPILKLFIQQKDKGLCLNDVVSNEKTVHWYRKKSIFAFRTTTIDAIKFSQQEACSQSCKQICYWTFELVTITQQHLRIARYQGSKAMLWVSDWLTQ